MNKLHDSSPSGCHTDTSWAGWSPPAPAVMHYGRIAWYAIGDDDGNLPLHITWLLGTALVFGALAIAGYWRDQGKQYG